MANNLATLRARLAKAKERASNRYTLSDTWQDAARRPWSKPHGGSWQSLEHMPRSSAHSRAYYCDAWPDGFRHVGTAYDVCRGEHSRRVEHTGWYTDSFQSGTLSGHVLQLPARDGKACYVPGTAHSEWDGVTLYPLDMYDDALDAASAADQYAEHAAESEREYQAREDAKIQIDELRDTIATLRSDARALIRDMKSARRNGLANYPAICAALREKLADVRDESHKAYQRIEKLTDNFWNAVPNY